MKDPEDKSTIDLVTPTPKKQWGGWREGGGRKKVDYTTKMFRADVRLSGIIEALKARLKSGAMNDEDLKRFEELAAN
ncbi:MAG: hypothetical protein WCL34_12875 [Methylococcaceae bacterium]